MGKQLSYFDILHW